MGFNLLDVALLLVMLLFMLRGFFRGFLDEVAGLIGIVGGIWLAGTFHTRLGQLVLPYLNEPLWANLAAFLLILCAVLLAVSAVVSMLHKFLTLTFTDWLSHLIGGIAGLIKGFVICAIAIALMQHFLVDAPFMSTSKVRPHIEKFSLPLIRLLPLNIAAHAADKTARRFECKAASPHEIRIAA